MRWSDRGRDLIVEDGEGRCDRGIATGRRRRFDVVHRRSGGPLALHLGEQVGVGLHAGALVFGRLTVDVRGGEFELFAVVGLGSCRWWPVGGRAGGRVDGWIRALTFADGCVVPEDVGRVGPAPRAIRDLTVPTGMPSASAISA